ncbi:TPA: aminoglycoside adenylyltransferase domain-containing protein, partial [Escherichia coli]|nr:DUF4111 domain-containing protein [Escherichia coli]
TKGCLIANFATVPVSERLPAEHRPLICKARAAYLGSEDDDLAMRVEETAAFVRYAKATIERILR